MAENPDSHLPRRERELAAGLRQWAAGRGRGGKVRVPLNVVREVFHGIRDRNPDDAFESTVISHLLRTLEEQEIIKPLQRRTPDKIPLPVAVWLLSVPAPQRVRAPMPPWHPELSFLAVGWKTTGHKQRAAYTAINTWLKSSPDLTPLPLRERALEILGAYGSEAVFPCPEKGFDDLRSGLFADAARLDRLIRVFRPPIPLLTETFPGEDETGHFHRVGQGDLLLVVENSTTWWSIVDRLPKRHRLGYVAWGVGSSFRASIRSVTARHRISEIRYFGDLDLSGLAIPLKASRTAVATGLPPVLPAVALYDLLFSVGLPRRGAERPAAAVDADSLSQWLPPHHRPAASALLASGTRIAQEWANHRHLTRNTTWHQDIR